MKPCKICGLPQTGGYIICSDCAEKVERLQVKNERLQEAITAAWLQLHTATFSTSKGASELAKFILTFLPQPPEKTEDTE